MGRWGTGRARIAAAVLVATLAVAGCSSDSGDDGAQSGVDPTSPAGDGATSGSLHVLAYNVAGLPQEISGEQPAVNIPKISPLLDAYDVVLTQEDFDWWLPGGLAEGLDFVSYHDRLWADTTFEFRTQPHPGNEAVGIDLADRPDLQIGDGLAVGSRFPIGLTDRVPWTECFGGFNTDDGGAADCLAMKGFSLTRITVAEGVEVDVYNLHAEAGGSDRDQALQADDFRQLATYIDERSGGRPIILGGDTNLHTGGEHADGEDGLDRDIWQAFLDATGLTDGCEATDCPEPERIDKFAFRSSDDIELGLTDYGFETEVFVDEEGADLSDHQALAATFTWRRLG